MSTGAKKKIRILIRKCRKLTEKTKYIKDITLTGNLKTVKDFKKIWNRSHASNDTDLRTFKLI